MKSWARRRPSPLPATSGSEDPAGEHRLPLLPFPVTLQAAQLHSSHSCHFILHLNVHRGVGAHLNGGKQTTLFSGNSEPTRLGEEQGRSLEARGLGLRPGEDTRGRQSWLANRRAVVGAVTRRRAGGPDVGPVRVGRMLGAGLCLSSIQQNREVVSELKSPEPSKPPPPLTREHAEKARDLSMSTL